jgi:hypothetical protein
MFGMLWIDVYNSVFQFPQLCTAIAEWDNIPHATINSIINSMRRKCVVLHEANGGHTRYWFSDPCPYLFFKAHYMAKSARRASHYKVMSINMEFVSPLAAITASTLFY